MDKGQSCTDQTTFDKTSTFLFATINEGTPLSQNNARTEDPRVDLGIIPWCEKLYPRFNSAVFIKTMVVDDGLGYKVPVPMHQVLPIKYPAELEGFFRFGLTGWYTDVGDLMSENRKRERDKMRARD
jgi:hypothetical protein